MCCLSVCGVCARKLCVLSCVGACTDLCLCGVVCVIGVVFCFVSRCVLRFDVVLIDVCVWVVLCLCLVLLFVFLSVCCCL